MIKAEDLRIGDIVQTNKDCMFPRIRAVAILLANRLATAYFVRMCARVKTP